MGLRIQKIIITQMKKYNFSIAGGIIILAIGLLLTSCKKEVAPPSSKVLDLIQFDSLGYWPGYIACGNTGNTNADWINFTFAASSLEGEVTITQYVYHIETNTPGALPITTMSMWSDNVGNRSVIVTGSEVVFSNMNNFVPVSDNGVQFSVSFTYSGIGRNKVVAGQTTCQVVLDRVTYVDRYGLSRTKEIGLRSRKKMLTHSFLSFGDGYRGVVTRNGLHVGMVYCYDKSFNVITSGGSSTGSIALETIPLRYKTSGCTLTKDQNGLPIVYMVVRENTGQSSTSAINVMSCTKINDSTVGVIIPPSYAPVTNKIGITTTFYMNVSSIDSTDPGAFLRVGLGDPKALSFLDKITNTRYTIQNEAYMYLYWYYWSVPGTPYGFFDECYQTYR